MKFFSRVGGAFKVGGKIAWKMYNKKETQVLLTALLPVVPLAAVHTAIQATEMAVAHHKDARKRDHARRLVLEQFPVVAESGNDKLINFMIEAKLQEMSGNVSID